MYYKKAKKENTKREREFTKASVNSSARCSVENVICVPFLPFLMLIMNSLLVFELGLISTNSLYGH